MLVPAGLPTAVVVPAATVVSVPAILFAAAVAPVAAASPVAAAVPAAGFVSVAAAVPVAAVVPNPEPACEAAVPDSVLGMVLGRLAARMSMLNAFWFCPEAAPDGSALLSGVTPALGSVFGNCPTCLNRSVHCNCPDCPVLGKSPELICPDGPMLGNCPDGPVDNCPALGNCPTLLVVGNCLSPSVVGNCLSLSVCVIGICCSLSVSMPGNCCCLDEGPAVSVESVAEVCGGLWVCFTTGKTKPKACLRGLEGVNRSAGFTPGAP